MTPDTTDGGVSDTQGSPDGVAGEPTGADAPSAPTCPASTPVGCGETLSGVVTASDGAMTDYACGPAGLEGGEVAYLLQPDTLRAVTVTVAGEEGAELVALLIQGGCTTDHCTDFVPATPGTVTLFAGPDRPAVLVVDGAGGASAELEVTVTCAETCEPNCEGRACGTDGCGGGCGPCAPTEVCDGDGQCRAPDAGDACEDALSLDVPGAAAGDTSTSLDTYTVAPQSCPGFLGAGAVAGAPDTVYRVEPTAAGRYRFVADGVGDTAPLLLATTDCDAFETQCLGAAPAGAPLLVDLSPPTSVYLVVDGTDLEGGPFTLTAEVVEVPAGDGCAEAAILGLDAPSVVDTTNALDDVSFEADACPGLPSGVDAGAGSGDIVHAFTAPASGRYRFAATPDPGDQVLLTVSETCALDGDTCLAGGVGGAGETVELAVDLDGGDVVFVVADAGGAARGPIEVTAAAVAVPPNDACADATVIDPAALPVVLVGDTSGATDSASASLTGCDGLPGGAGAGGRDVLYALAAPDGGRYRLSLEATGWDAALWVTDACGHDTACVAGVDHAASPSAESLEVELAPGAQVFVAVDASDGSAGAFELAVQAIDPPAHDACAEPLALAGALPLEVAGSTEHASDSLELVGAACPGVPAAGLGGGTPDVFYELTPSHDAEYQVHVVGDAGALPFVTLATSCDALGATCVAAAGGVGLTAALEAGVPVVLAVDTVGPPGAFTLTVDLVASPPNDTCDDAAALEATGPVAAATGSGLGGTTATTLPPGCEAAGEGPDTFHTFVPTDSGPHTLTATGAGGLAVLDGCGGTPGCVAAGAAGGSVVADLEAGEAYTVVVRGDTPYTLTVDGAAAAPANQCGVATPLAAGTTAGATDDIAFAAGCAGAPPFGSGQPDRFHTLTAGAAAVHRVTLDADGTAPGTRLAALETCGDPTSCLGSVGPGGHLDLPLAAGETTTLVVEGGPGPYAPVVTPLPAPPGDTCAAPLELTVGAAAVQVTGTTEGALDGAVVVALTATATGQHELRLAPGFDGTLTVSAACDDDAAAEVLATGALVVVDLEADLPVFVVVGGASVAGAFTLEATWAGAAAPEACGDGEPVELAPGALVLAGTTALATDDQAAECPGLYPPGVGAADVVYSLTSPEPVTLEARLTAAFDAVLSLHEGCGACLDGADDNGGGGATEVVSATLAAGEVYSLAIDGWSVAAAGTFTLVIEASPLPGITCEEATALGALPATLGGSFVGTTDALVLTGEACPGAPPGPGWAPGWGAGGGEAWFGFTAPAAGLHEVSVTPAAPAVDTVVSLWSGCDGACLGAANQAAGSTDRLLVDLDAGSDYVVAVDAAAGAAGPFTIEVRAAPPPPGSSCAEPLPLVSTLSGTTVGAPASACGPGSEVVAALTATTDGSWLVEATATDSETPPLLVPLEACGAAPSCALGSPAHLVELAAGQTRLFLIESPAGQPGPFEATAALAPAPAAESCGDALTLSVGMVTAGSTVGATDDLAVAGATCGLPGAGLVGDGAADVTYRVEAPADGVYRFQVAGAGAGFVPALYLLSACGLEAQACLGASPGGWPLDVWLHGGDAVVVVVDGASGASGLFELTTQAL